MTLSMSLGMAIGVRRTFWMMWGELFGVGLVCIAAAAGVAAMMLHYPTLFVVFKYAGGAYLLFLGIRLWCSKGKMAIGDHTTKFENIDRGTLALQGFITAIANPKGWAFMISLLPPFINPKFSMAPQMIVLLSIILIIEFFCMVIYASGGQTLRSLLNQKGTVRLLNRIAGSLIAAVGIWLAF